ncbi:GtrA family protein [Foetidibacter luteolus]|uniref:GtrA family protein n=1 Tax=Foetidibacter luteolus TaxID=2608880 RepID=UPI00129ABB32|nr:GtrA family protein [Foetidibacter luteolus]
MKKLHLHIKTTILSIVDFFYPPFSRFIPQQTFRYAACGGTNTALDICLFFICYNYILKKQNLNLGAFTLSPHIASFFLSFCVTFPFGFYLSRYVIFQESDLKGRIQLFRYFVVIMGCIFLNYVFLKLFVDHLGWYPTPSKMLTTVFVVIFSYVSQTYFSFRKTETGE